MRILIYGINYSPELTGIGKYTGEMAEWLVQQGNDVSVITAMPYYPEWNVHKEYKGKLWHKELINGVKVYRCPLYVPKNVNSKKRIVHEFSFLLTSSFSWTGMIFKKKFDLIITLAPPFHIGIHSYIYSLLKKTTVVNHIQDLQIDAAKDLSMLNNGKVLKSMLAIERFILQKGNYVSTLTLGMKQHILNKGIEKDKILMLPNWVDLDFIRPLSIDKSLRGQYDIPQNDIVILYSGNMGKKQGLELIIEVACEYKDRSDIHFLMVGSGVEKENLITQATEKKLMNVKFYPLQAYEQLPSLLATADLHLVLQKKEASDLVMPSKLTGILSAGGCAIVTAVPETSLYNIIKENDIGILCEPESSVALKNAIDRALSSDLSVYKRNARIYAEKYLDKNNILSQFFEDLDKK